MKKYQPVLKKEKLWEIANITSKYSGLKKGIIQIRPEERHKYFPHIHFILNVKKANNEYIKLTLRNNEEDIKIIESKNLTLNNKQLKVLKNFIILNYDRLVTYYNQAEFLDTIEFFNLIKKI